jgi:hypothetical protein
LGSGKSFFIDEQMLIRKNIRLKSAVDPNILKHAVTAIYRRDDRNVARVMKALKQRNK